MNRSDLLKGISERLADLFLLGVTLTVLMGYAGFVRKD